MIIYLELTVNSPVTASKPTWTVCSKFVGYDILGLESWCDGFEPLILFFKVFFLRSGSSGSVKQKHKTLRIVGKDVIYSDNKYLLAMAAYPHRQSLL